MFNLKEPTFISKTTRDIFTLLLLLTLKSYMLYAINNHAYTGKLLNVIYANNLNILGKVVAVVSQYVAYNILSTCRNTFLFLCRGVAA